MKDTRERIIEGAADLFRMYGIRSVTMDTIASNLGISKRTIYEIFKDKDELLKEVLAWMMKEHKSMLSRVLKETENSIYAIFRLLEINRDHFRNMSPLFISDLKKYYADISKGNTWNNELPDYRSNQKVIEKGIQEKLFRDNINPDLVNRCLHNLGTSIMNNEIYPFEEF